MCQEHAQNGEKHASDEPGQDHMHFNHEHDTGLDNIDEHEPWTACDARNRCPQL